MAVGFILGRSGTGKSRFCIDSIVKALAEPADTRRLILLVPEQATFQAERAILSDKTVAGYGSRLTVLSFDRLEFLLLGRNTAKTSISRLGRQMLIQRLLREHQGRLRVFGRCVNQPGLGRAMAETIAQLHQYDKGPDDVDRLVQQLQAGEEDSLAALKFADVGLVLKEYLAFIEGKFLDPDVQLRRVRSAAAQAGWLKGARVWVDGFAGFTTAQLAVLTELLKVAGGVQIALCLDASRVDLAEPAAGADPVDLFYPTLQTYTELIDIVKKCRLKLSEPLVLKEPLRFEAARQLGHIERNIFAAQPQTASAGGAVRIAAAPDLRREVRFVAAEIVRLVREKALRYRDIAVIASDLEGYEHYIRAYFSDYSVPFFIDKPKNLSGYPVSELVCSALQVLTGGFSSPDVFSYLKSGLAPIEDDQIYRLENYCLAFGITGGDWTGARAWDFAGADNEDFDQQAIEKLRLQAVRPLVGLRNKLCRQDGSSRQISSECFTRAVFDFLERLGVRERMGLWIEEALEQGNFAAADEHREFYDRFVDLFDEFTEVFGDEKLSCEDYLAIVRSAFSQLTLAFIPPGLDQVLVGSVERSRHPDLKAVFLIGATEKSFPVPLTYSTVLTDDDRQAAERAQFLLGSTTARKLAERQYLAYIAFTRASRFLYVTYPVADQAGSGTARSQFVTDLEALFEDLVEERISDEKPDVERLYSKGELSDLLCGRLGRDSFYGSSVVSDTSARAARGRLVELLEGLCGDRELGPLGSAIVSAINYENHPQLDKQITSGLFGGEVEASATRLSSFAACPYRYFARYILELRKRKEFKLEPLDVGNFYHRVLDLLLKELNAEKEDIATIKDDRLLEILRRRISLLVQTDSFISKFARHSAQNQFIIHSAGEALEDCVLAVKKMAGAGGFRPVLSEVFFGDVKDSCAGIGEFKIDIPDGRQLFLNGKIDRLDAVTLEGEKLALVFDYKKAGSYFNWSKFYHGLDMQLPIYMLAVRNADRSKWTDCAGAFYIPIEPGPVKDVPLPLAKKEKKFDYKAKGIFNGRFYDQLDVKAKSGWNTFYNFYTSREDEQYGNYDTSGALRPDDFEKVLRFAEAKIIELAEQITSGRIEIKPYMLGTASPCTWCEYRSLCRFDWQVNDYNFLDSVGKPYVLEKIGD